MSESQDLKREKKRVWRQGRVTVGENRAAARGEEWNSYTMPL